MLVHGGDGSIFYWKKSLELLLLHVTTWMLKSKLMSESFSNFLNGQGSGNLVEEIVEQ